MGAERFDGEGDFSVLFDFEHLNSVQLRVGSLLVRVAPTIEGSGHASFERRVLSPHGQP